MGSTKHLKPHQFSVPDGDEPLSKKPISIRLYASDDEAIRAMGNDGRLFVRKAVRMLLQQRADRHANTGPSSTYE